MKITCVFKSSELNDEEFYFCRFINRQINADEELVINGLHNGGKTNRSVTGVLFSNCKMTSVPQKLTEKFPKLRLLYIFKSNLKSLNKNDLSEYKNLEFFCFDGNRIEYLPGDLFDGFENVKMISFSKNNLKFIEPNILDGCNKLKLVDFSKNSNYNKIYSDDTDDSNATLQEIKFNLLEKLHARFKSFQEIENLNANLAEENQTLKVQLANEKILGLKISQRQESFLINDLKKLTQDETCKDFKIIIDGREFPVHKFLLAARSPTLAEMLRNNPKAENLKLVDISVEIFELILKFLYTDELPSKRGTNFMQIFAAAGRLRIEELKNFAAVKLNYNISMENALEILNLCNKYGHDQLRQKAFDEIKKNFPEIEFKDEWIENGEKIEAFIIRAEMLRKFDEGIFPIK